jgi:hypothetical protein
MPKTSKETASRVVEMGPVTDRGEDLGGYMVNFVSFAADADLDGPLQALPGGACQCPHWAICAASAGCVAIREPRADVPFCAPHSCVCVSVRCARSVLGVVARPHCSA